MGMTLWISTLDGRNLTKNTNDHSMMYRHADTLDRLCDLLTVEKLSSFFDFTALQHDFKEELDDEEEQHNRLDPETGYEYGIDDMTWFDSASGLTTLTALHANIDTDAELKTLKETQRRQLIDEFNDCLTMLRDSAARNGKFHLAVIM